MDENTEMMDEQPDIPDEEESEDLAIVEKIIGVYISPVSTFKYLAKKPDFWTALVIISLITIALGLLTLPKIMPIQETETITQMQAAFDQAGMSEDEQAEAMGIALKGLRIFTYVIVIIGPPIGLAFAWLLFSAMVFFIALFQGLNTDFKRLLGILPWLSCIGIISSIISSISLFYYDNPTIEHIRNPSLLNPISLLKIIPGSVELPTWLNPVLAMIDPFFIWWGVGLVIALEAANKCSRQKAITTTIITILILIVLTALMGFVLGAIGQPG